MNVYKNCPQFSNERYLLRLTKETDVDDLLKVYSDVKSVPFFNSDNCHGNNFYYTSLTRMRQAVVFWQGAYNNGWFVRWSVIDITNNVVVGAIEEFRRDSNDYFTDCGLLRLDLRSDYEKADEIESILSLIVRPSFQMFGCSMVAVKAVADAVERIDALKRLGFIAANERLTGGDGALYGNYFILKR